MSWSYASGGNPPIDYPRLLIADTDPTKPIFQDEEILAMEQIVTTPFQSGMFWSTPNGPLGGGTLGVNLPQIPIPYYRVAGMLLNAIASNRSRLSSVMKILDVTLDPSKAAKALQEQAKTYLDIDDNSGAFMVIEQVNDDFSFRSRFWKQYQRQSAGGF